MQKTNFPIEILIHDDASTDGTTELIKTYENKYPKLIKPVYQKENQFSKGKKITPILLNKACGKYIALCEGDDYWTDPLKLQKQVDFLEANLDYSICFHNVKIYIQEKNTFQKDTITRTVDESTCEEYLARGNYIHTPSVVFINDFEIPSWFDKVTLGDWSLYMLSIKGRKIFKFEEKMAVYRLHSDSIWSKLDQEKRNSLTKANVEILYKNLKLRSNTKNILRNRLGLKVKRPLLKRIINKLK